MNQLLGGKSRGVDAKAEPDGDIIIRHADDSALRDLRTAIQPETLPSASAPGGEVLRIPAAKVQEVRRDFTRAMMQVAVSVALLAGGIYFLIAGSADVQKAAAGWIGIVAGYWLR